MPTATSSTSLASSATKPLKNRIAVVFDFDDTLAPDALDGLLAFLSIDSDEFRQQQVHPLEADGWEHVTARCYSLIKESHQRGESDKITYDNPG